MGWMHPQPENRFYYGGYPADTGVMMPQLYPQQHLQTLQSVTTTDSISPGSDSNGSAMDGSYLTSSYPSCPCLPSSHLHTPSVSNQQISYMAYNDFGIPNSTINSTRMLRNMAEKQRRDKLNTYISELAALLPMVSNSPKRMDKTSILRSAATFLRMNRFCSNSKEWLSNFPAFLDNVDWSQFLLDEIDGVMLIVTEVGKIVFISHNIENILGHTQTELFGQNLYSITCPEDHSDLSKYLAPDPPDDYFSECDLESEGSRVTSSESSVNSSTTTTRSNTSRRSNLPSSQPKCDSSSSEPERQRRSFYIRLKHRCLPRSDQPQYELVHILGFLRVPKKLTSHSQQRSRKHKETATVSTSNEILLVAVMRPFRERRVTEISLMEACQDEYVTRHTLDGRIIFADHRISTASGYLPEEVTSLQAFNFMHKDDVGWVMVALRQMFYAGESYGSSCYRLKSRTGEFIYVKTYGYLELNANMESFVSFICINTLVSSAEGEYEIRQMQKKFSALVESKTEPGIAAIAENQLAQENCGTHFCGTADPDKIKKAVRALVYDLPKTVTLHEDPEKSKNMNFVKAKLISKTLPPVSSANFGSVITMVDEKSGKTIATSPQPTMMSPQSHSTTTSLTSNPSTPVSLTPTSPPVISSQAAQNRPSVLRIAPSLASRRPVTIYNGVENCVSTTTTSGNESDRDLGTEYDSGSRDVADQSMEDLFSDSKLSIKQKLPSDFDSVDLTSLKPENTERAGVVHCVIRLPLYNKCDDSVTRRLTTKRHSNFEETTFSSVPIKKSVVSPADVTTNGQELPFRELNASSLQQQSYSHNLSSYPTLSNGSIHLNDQLTSSLDDFTHIPTIEECDRAVQIDDIDISETKPDPELFQLLDNTNEDLRHSHMKLESRMHLQGAQINAIEGDLDKVSFTPGRSCLETNLGKLKEQHSQQEKMLKSLRQDHHSLQNRNVDNVNVLNIRHNVGV